jgi:hypothetical protein
LLGVKRPERGVNHQPPSNAEVEERVELYLYPLPLFAFMAGYRLNFTIFEVKELDIAPTISVDSQN